MEISNAISAFLLVLLLIPVVRALALRTGFVDRPGGRKQHDAPVPPIGGLVIVPVFIGLNLLHGETHGPQIIFYSALALLTFIGFLDDRGDVNAWVKFFIQIVASYALVAAGPARVWELGNLFGTGTFDLGWMSVPFSMAAIVLLVNAVNLIDGVDGLAAGKSLVALLWLIAACGLAAGQFAMAVPAMILAGCLCGFLAYNMRHPFRRAASVFLGDAGSLALGLSLAWFAIDFAQGPDAVLPPIAVAWILALPIMDVCAQFYRRVLEKRHPFSPDRGHFHHHLIEAGFGPGQAAMIMLMLGVVSGAIGVLGPYCGVPMIVLTFGWIALILVHMRISKHPENYVRIFTALRRRVCG